MIKNKVRYFERFLTLFDAVVAIVMTILVLDIRIPENIHEFNMSTVWMIVGMLMWYALSFYLIFNYWNIHHRIIQGVTGANERFVAINFTFLFFLSLFPVACIFLNSSGREGIVGDVYKFAIIFYMSINMLVSVTQFFIINYIKNNPDKIDIDDDYNMEVVDDAARLGIVKVFAYVIPFICAFIFPTYTWYVFAFTSLFVSRTYKRFKFESKKMG